MRGRPPKRFSYSSLQYTSLFLLLRKQFKTLNIQTPISRMAKEINQLLKLPAFNRSVEPENPKACHRDAFGRLHKVKEEEENFDHYLRHGSGRLRKLVVQSINGQTNPRPPWEQVQLETTVVWPGLKDWLRNWHKTRHIFDAAVKASTSLLLEWSGVCDEESSEANGESSQDKKLSVKLRWPLASFGLFFLVCVSILYNADSSDIHLPALHSHEFGRRV
jgi:hypothetical protein